MKKRLDMLMVEKNITSSRSKAKELIQNGSIFVNGNCILKAGELVAETDEIELRGEVLKYVSRGGLKLEKAITDFNIDLNGKICIDIGASTGGFTDCMLQNGAIKVYAIDVGTDQLAESLRKDPRVVVMEQTNIRALERNAVEDEIDFVSIDVSFISLEHVLPVAALLLKDGGEIVCLVKPQFEAGAKNIGKSGVVKNINIHRDVLNRVLAFMETQGIIPEKLEYSPIKGPKGNIEFLVMAKKTEETLRVDEKQVSEVLRKAHEVL